jgi:hypothetical protein
MKTGAADFSSKVKYWKPKKSWCQLQINFEKMVGAFN